MADPARRWPVNAPGRFYVDHECIDCDMCRSLAPDFFERSEEGYSYVAHQPGDAQGVQDCQQALEECPAEAIGDGAAESEAS